MSPARSTPGCPPAAEMVHATSSSLLLLLLSLALLAPGISARKCLLTGNWTNDLGSNMTIGAVNDRGEFSGTYLTAVADTPNNITKSPLLGIQNNTVYQPTFGFTVQWAFIESTTVFTGQCFMDRNGKEVLKTMWLLRSSVDDIDDDWKATRVGNNVFTRLRSVKE
uniref:Avidin n=1 Tax=Chrysolophus pictus TaxID=9089 RepID=A0A8C3L5R1_CHRPC